MSPSGRRGIVDAHLLPAFGELPLERVTPDLIERWRRTVMAGRSPRTANKLLVALHSIFERARRVYGLATNSVKDVERLKERRDPGKYDFYDVEEVWALVRAAESEQDAAIFMTASFSGLRMGELLALRWADVDFAAETIRVSRSYTGGNLTSPKSGLVRSLPMVEDVAQALARLAQRERFTARDDLVFAGVAGDFLDGSALRRRYKAAAKRANPPADQVPRSPAHLRLARHQQRERRAGPALDGPRRRPDDVALSPPSEPSG